MLILDHKRKKLKILFSPKNKGYMVLRISTLTSNLPGMLEEYKQYVYLIEDETVEGLTNTLRGVFCQKQKRNCIKKG